MKKQYLALLAASCVAVNAADVNYDLLGRKNSKMNSPMVYKDIDYSKMKKSEEQTISSSLGNHALTKRASGTKNAKAIVGKFGPGGYAFSDCGNLMTGVACGESVTVGRYDGKSVNSYLNKANKKFIKVSVDNRDLPSSYQYASEAGPSRSYLSGYYMQEMPYVVPSPYPVEASPYESNKTIKYYPYFGLYDYAYSGWLNNSNVGVYLSEEGLPTRLNPAMSYAPFFIADDKPMDIFNSMIGFEMRASKMYRALELTSLKSRFFVSKTRPSNPSTTTPQIYMGLHADGGTPTKKYSSAAKTLDNYIYDNRTVEIVGAGNKSTKGVGGKALAANAITVGAIDPFTNKATGYSAGCKERPCYETFYKPEFMNYSHYYFDFPNLPEYSRTYTKGGNYYEYKPLYDGTEAAAALTAGMVSNMLSTNEFYRWHPEVVKAVALNTWQRKGNADTRLIRYDDLVFNQSDENNRHFSYYFIGDVNTLMKEYKDSPNKTDIFCLSSCKEIRIDFSRNDLIPNADARGFDGFNVSIAWLNSGNDIYNLGGIPQKFEIEVFSRWGNPNMSTSLSHNAERIVSSRGGYSENREENPFKTIRVGGFYQDYNKDFTLRIVLTDEDSRAENYGQMVLGLDIQPILK